MSQRSNAVTRHLRPGFVKNRLPPQPPGMCRQPLTVALPQSASALHCCCSKSRSTVASMIFRISGGRRWYFLHNLANDGLLRGPKLALTHHALQSFEIATERPIQADAGKDVRLPPCSGPLRHKPLSETLSRVSFGESSNVQHEPINQDVRPFVFRRSPAYFARTRFRFERGVGDWH
jgi:hypothetical protein